MNQQYKIRILVITVLIIQKHIKDNLQENLSKGLRTNSVTAVTLNEQAA